MKTRFILITIFALTLPFANQAHADKCGKNDRVPLPSCVSYSITKQQQQFDIKNNCSFPVTIKVDIENDKDKRITVNPTKSQIGTTENSLTGDMFVEAIHIFSGKAKIRGLKCCPKYGRCS